MVRTYKVEGFLPKSAGLKDVWASSLFSLASLPNAERGGGGGERGVARMLESHRIGGMMGDGRVG